MGKRRIAANRVYTSPHDYKTNHVVEIEDGHIARLYPLTAELAHTEWLSGVIVLTNRHINQPSDMRTIADFYPDNASHEATQPTVVYHIRNLATGCTQIDETMQIIEI